MLANLVPMYAPAPGFIPPCLPTIAKQALTGPVYEIEHDGYRLMVRRAEQCLYIFSRSAHCRGGSPIAREVFLLDGEGIVYNGRGHAEFQVAPWQTERRCGLADRLGRIQNRASPLQLRLNPPSAIESALCRRCRRQPK
jgi:hypothetical protein